MISVPGEVVKMTIEPSPPRHGEKEEMEVRTLCYVITEAYDYL